METMLQVPPISLKVREPMVSPVHFILPPELEAHLPAELSGRRRDDVRLMVLPRTSGAPIHTRFDALGDFLRPGDLMVVNDSRTLPGLLHAHDDCGRHPRLQPHSVQLCAFPNGEVRQLLLHGER